MKLWLVRHAPVLLPAGVCYGSTDVAADTALSQHHAQQLAKVLPAGVTVRVSARQRAQQLAQCLHQFRPDLPAPCTDARLNEIDFGCWELQRWDDIPRTAYDAWTADFWQHRFGGKESVRELLLRVHQALQDTHTHSTHASTTPCHEAVWITHAGVIRAVQWLATHGLRPIEQAAQWPRVAPEPGQWLCLD